MHSSNSSFDRSLDSLQFSPDTYQRPIKDFAFYILPPLGTRVRCFRGPPGTLLKGSVCGEAVELSRAVLPSPDQSWRFPGREEGLQPLPCQEGQRTRGSAPRQPCSARARSLPGAALPAGHGWLYRGLRTSGLPRRSGEGRARA